MRKEIKMERLAPGACGCVGSSAWPGSEFLRLTVARDVEREDDCVCTVTFADERDALESLDVQPEWAWDNFTMSLRAALLAMRAICPKLWSTPCSGDPLAMAMMSGRAAKELTESGYFIVQ